MQKAAPLSFAFIVGTTCLAFVVSQLDISIVNVALPQISRSLGADVSQLQWIVDAYTIAFAVLMLSAGGMGDLLGAKHLFQLGLVAFGLASAGCGFAESPLSLIIFRALQGLGSAIMIPSSLAILNQSFAHDNLQRSRAVSFWTAAGSIAIASGLILGGLLLQVSNWRMIFFVNLPICLIGLLLSVRLAESEKHPNNGFDIPGQLTWMVALTILIACIIELHHFGFGSLWIYGGLIFSIVAFILFIVIEKRATAPILSLDLFRSAHFNVIILLGMVFNSAYYGTIFVLSLYLQNVLHYSALAAGIAFLPLTGGFVISNLLSGRAMNRYGIRVPVLTGIFIFIVGFAELYSVKADTPYWRLFIPFFTIPLGMGLAIPAMTTAILGGVTRTLSGTVSAIFNTSRQAAGAMGVAVYGTIAYGGTAAVVNSISISAIATVAVGLCAAFLVYKNLKRAS
ncbi:MAG: MFS transporter [Mucilaginibacter sp.]